MLQERDGNELAFQVVITFLTITEIVKKAASFCLYHSLRELLSGIVLDQVKFSHEDIKLFIYGGSGLGGVFMLVLSAILYFRSRYTDNPIEYALPCIILFVSGIVCILFAVQTFVFRDERDSWN